MVRQDVLAGDAVWEIVNTELTEQKVTAWQWVEDGMHLD